MIIGFCSNYHLNEIFKSIFIDYINNHTFVF